MLISSFYISGCAYDSFENFAYDAAHTRQCIKETGDPNCEPDRTSYDEYEDQREEIRNQY